MDTTLPDHGFDTVQTVLMYTDPETDTIDLANGIPALEEEGYTAWEAGQLLTTYAQLLAEEPRERHVLPEDGVIAKTREYAEELMNRVDIDPVTYCDAPKRMTLEEELRQLLHEERGALIDGPEERREYIHDFSLLPDESPARLRGEGVARLLDEEAVSKRMKNDGVSPQQALTHLIADKDYQPVDAVEIVERACQTLELPETHGFFQLQHDPSAALSDEERKKRRLQRMKDVDWENLGIARRHHSFLELVFGHH